MSPFRLFYTVFCCGGLSSVLCNSRRTPLGTEALFDCFSSFFCHPVDSSVPHSFTLTHFSWSSFKNTQTETNSVASTLFQPPFRDFSEFNQLCSERLSLTSGRADQRVAPGRSWEVLEGSLRGLQEAWGEGY